ncbi:GNAT family N-acetyltransferase [Pseudooctadecabacter jejudonensis]|uniref:Putative N-acetyltransferase YafP n=1 Tax=Pseudooctadecabacter jejudonensis TaxID=1391910 RepID=A0A1Y5RQI0_9RHOB|nr:GNAT family N-acetyltransferase [Pseudooctadecabacter jejudonensis]SLN22085.1 putative N-acetyltransferase YafP [Pseudooctadecabacter jejudonensis]
MDIRSYEAADAGALAQVFYAAVQIGAAEVFTKAQRDAWAPRPPTAEDWAKRLDRLETVVAHGATGPIGFMSVNLDDGDLDLAFVAPEERGTGVAAALYAVIEGRARSAGLRRLQCHASPMARRFFERAGWTVVRPNPVARRGVVLDNWVMEKQLV